jgi:hypothetical protein
MTIIQTNTSTIFSITTRYTTIDSKNTIYKMVTINIEKV